MKKLLMIAVVALMAVACNKDQRAVKKLDGTWKATSLTVSEGATTIDVLESGMTYKMTFDGCKLKDDEFCNLTVTLANGTDSETNTFIYRVTNDGTRMETKEDAASTSIDAIEIEELTRSSLKLTQTDDGATTNITLEKE